MKSANWFHTFSKGLARFFPKNPSQQDHPSDRKQTDEEHLRLLFDSSPAGVAVVHARTRKRLYANPRFLELFAVESLDELDAVDMSETYVNKTDWEKVRNHILSGSSFRRDIFQRKRVNGEHWWALLDAVPLEFMGEPAVVVWHTDVTDQKKAENKLETTLVELKESRNALQESEKRLRQLFDSSPAGIVALRIGTGQRLYGNSRLLEMFNVQSLDALNKFGLSDTYVNQRDWETARDYIQNGTAFRRFIVERKRVTGERWWALLDAVPMDFMGERCIVVWHTDITEQKQAEKELEATLAELKESRSALEESEKHLRQILETSPIGVSIVGDEIKERAYTNSTYLKLFGAESLEELDAYGFVNSFVSKNDYELANQHFNTGVGPDSTIMPRRKVNGEEWWAKIYAVPIIHQGKNTFIIWCTDITDQKKAEAELVQSEKLASLGGMVAGVAHEINTPIGVGVTAASHLQERTEVLKGLFEQDLMKKSSFEEFLETATQSSAIISANLMRAADLIRSFKQVAVDQSVEEMRSFKLLEYVREVMQSLNPQLKKNPNVVVLIDGDEDLEMESYPGSIAQILTNLVLNSMIHGFPENEPGQISITAQPDGTAAQLVYKDTGRGIDAENLPKVFDPFFTTNRSAGGSGLGLHIVYNLVTQKLGGTVTCDSAPGEGVTITFHIPLQLGHSE
ncbi:PAS domain-containing sensor histidine kinase [Hwanghaeella grinnelliae]|uniref:histidine kinase n=1 Tax=Hwanghaeella grinnelliae TaxID=2500179 RepID=A0A3S2ZAW8_9PROT|nr:PAS domain-containing sensor histidine kinase [Hwanghaeella grinnelliae]RVU38373.1 PAS domain-containing sensor histidine kinase [Hwanghaeella grinnelliae]